MFKTFLQTECFFFLNLQFQSIAFRKIKFNFPYFRTDRYSCQLFLLFDNNVIDDKDEHSINLKKLYIFSWPFNFH